MLDDMVRARSHSGPPGGLAETSYLDGDVTEEATELLFRT